MQDAMASSDIRKMHLRLQLRQIAICFLPSATYGYLDLSILISYLDINIWAMYVYSKSSQWLLTALEGDGGTALGT